MDKPVFRSKRFISALVGLVLMLVVAYVPELRAYEGPLAEAISQVILALIAGYSLTDITRDWLNRKTT
jgi:sterol desaturase/sphingolipid hydroxylase (fatty acid hydroxylase superfamily)